MRRGARRAGATLLAACVLLVGGPASAHPSVRSALRSVPALVGLPQLSSPQYQHAVDMFLESGVRNLPIHPAGSIAYTYRYDPDCDCYAKATEDIGPWYVTERAQPIGYHLLGVALTFGEFDEHGCDMPDHLAISAGAVQLRTQIERIYHVGTLTVTYGITQDLDVSLDVPVAGLDFGASGFVRGGTTGGSGSGSQQVDVPPNIMDMLVRAKYRVLESGGYTGAVGMRAWLPTGDVANGLGTGDGEVGPFVALSTTFLQGWVDSHWDAGADVDVSHTRRSSAHYSWAFDVQPPHGTPLENVSFTTEFLGRSEFAGFTSRSSVSGPHVTDGGVVVNEPFLCLDPSRHDYADMILGVRWHVVRSLVLSAGTFKSLNEGTGVRVHGWSPVASIEAAF